MSGGFPPDFRWIHWMWWLSVVDGKLQLWSSSIIVCQCSPTGYRSIFIRYINIGQIWYIRALIEHHALLTAAQFCRSFL